MKNKTTFLVKNKYFFYALLATVIFFGCGNGENSINNGKTKYKIVVIDSCEYIEYNGYQRGYLFSHKGNCKYCAERNRRKQ